MHKAAEYVVAEYVVAEEPEGRFTINFPVSLGGAGYARGRGYRPLYLVRVFAKRSK